MVLPTYVVLHKSEWERLKQQSGQIAERAEGPSSDKYEYLKPLNEMSQEWMKNWPDTVAGHRRELEKQKIMQHKKDMTFIKAYAKTHQVDNSAEAIQNAKQIIFDRTSYGKKLLSALIESRTFKVREDQVKLKNKIQLENIEREKALDKHVGFDFESDEIKRNEKRKKESLKCLKVNQEMIKIKKEIQSKLEEEEKQCAIECEKVMDQIIKNEKVKQEELKRLVEQGIKEYEAESNALAKLRAREEKLDDDLIQVHKKAQEKINIKVKQIHQSRPETKRSKDLYEMMERILREKNKRFEDFLDKGIEQWEKRNMKKQEIDKLEEIRNRVYRRTIAIENKIKGEQDRSVNNNPSCAIKRVCQKQTIPLETKRKPLEKVECGAIVDEKKHSDAKTQSFLKLSSKLAEQLKLREKEPTPWNGTRGAHEQFAERAAAALKESYHKRLVHKVIDEYRKLNGLDNKTLPIPE